MSDLENVLEIVKGSYEAEIKRIQDEFINFMKKQAEKNVKNLDPWLKDEHYETYAIKDCTSSSFSKLITATNNLGFNVTQFDSSYFRVYIPKSNYKTVAQQFLEEYITSLEEETSRLDKLAKENFDILLKTINAKNFTVKKYASCWHIEVKDIFFPHPLIGLVAHRFCYLMQRKGFTGTCVTPTSCIFDINEVTHSKKCEIF